MDNVFFLNHLADILNLFLRLSVHDFSHKPIIDFQLGSAAVTETATGNPLTFILPLIAALVLSMVVIPIMVRLALRLGMIDQPDPRKVHATPIPRVGGVGVFIGAMVPIVLLLPIDQTLAAFIFGIAALTDYFDGWMARKYGLESEFGKFADPVMDKILILAPLVSFAVLGLYSPWWIVLILSGKLR